MPNNTLKDEVELLNKKLKKDSRIRLEVLAAISKVLRENGVDISTKLLGNLHFTIPTELPKNEQALSIDPGPSPEPSIDP